MLLKTARINYNNNFYIGDAFHLFMNVIYMSMIYVVVSTFLMEVFWADICGKGLLIILLCSGYPYLAVKQINV